MTGILLNLLYFTFSSLSVHSNRNEGESPSHLLLRSEGDCGFESILNSHSTAWSERASVLAFYFLKISALIKCQGLKAEGECCCFTVDITSPAAFPHKVVAFIIASLLKNPGAEYQGNTGEWYSDSLSDGKHSMYFVLRKELDFFIFVNLYT